jgi:hypothetical protein
MPAPSATTAAPRRHQWHLQFDRIVCRDCGAHFTDNDAEETCAGAEKIRPRAGMRDDAGFKPDLSKWPHLAKAWKQYQADRGRA